MVIVKIQIREKYVIVTLDMKSKLDSGLWFTSLTRQFLLQFKLCDELFCITMSRKEAGPCLNIDECKTHLHKCTRSSTCFDNIGSYECRCNEGYTGDGLSECYDLDECEAETHECAPERFSVSEVTRGQKR